MNDKLKNNDADTESGSNAATAVTRKSALERTIKKIFAAVLPVSLIGFSPKKASAQFDDLEIARAFNFILRIEFMQESFYLQATDRGGLFEPSFRGIFTRIRRQHQRRIVLINNTVGTLGLNPLPAGGFDFDFRSGAGFDPFSSFDNFLNLAQVLEDLSAGVYKEQAMNIYANNATDEIRQLILRLHSTEARHAYYVRFLRRQRGLDDIKGWINRDDLGSLSTAFTNIYADEATTEQENIAVPSITEADNQAVQEAWDEPIGRGPANDILQLFTRPI